MIYFLIIIYSFFLFFIIRGKIHKEKNTNTNKWIEEELSVLIPFRNEEKNLENLFKSIKNQEILPKNLIFINDHSDDNSMEILMNAKISNIKIMSLSDDFYGKKEALSFGVNFILTEYYLTLDADVILPDNYFINLEKLPKKDLWILPVKIKIQKFTDHFWRAEQLFLQATNKSAALFERPILASGANLLVKREKYLLQNTYQKTKNIASGDDMFLLKDFNRANYDIGVCTNPELAVSTNALSTMKENINQHIRWIKKNKYLQDTYANYIGICGLAALISSHVLLAILFVNFLLAGILALFGKLLLEYIILENQKKIGSHLLTPIFINLYPYLGIYIFLLSFFRKPSWKGRSTNVK